MSHQFLKYEAPKECQDLQDKIAFAGYFLCFDKDGRIGLWTWPPGADSPVFTHETYGSVEEAYGRVFRNKGGIGQWLNSRRHSSDTGMADDQGRSGGCCDPSVIG
jgi:hypothetical protein